MNMILMIIILCVLAFLLSRFFIDLSNHRKKMRQHSDNESFNIYVIQLSKEIIDSKVRAEFIYEYVDYIFTLTKYDYEFDIESEKRRIYKKWGEHIPSLISEFRDKKLKELGI